MASMQSSEAIKTRDALKMELREIEKVQASSGMALSILPKLVSKEIERLNAAIGDMLSKSPPLLPSDIRSPIDGESMLSIISAEFELSSAEATERFKQTLSFELGQLKEPIMRFPFTSEFIQIVIDHTKAYLKKQRLHECPVFGRKNTQIVGMDYNAAREKRERLRAERNIIRNRARAKAVDAHYLLNLMDAEIERLSDDIGDAILSMKSMSDEIKIPVEGASMLPRMPAEYDLSCAAETEKFIKNLRIELKWVMSLAEQFPLTYQFIQRVIGYAERYKREKRLSEGAYFGRTTDDQTAYKMKPEGTSAAHRCLSHSL